MLRDVVIPAIIAGRRPAHAVVGEVLIVDPRTRQLTWLGRTECAPIERSTLGISFTELARQIGWPPLGG